MEVKERILEKSHELFMRYGARSVSMDDIAAQLGMSKKTLYHYYADKEELVDAVLSGILETNRNRCMMDKRRAENAIHELFLAFGMLQEMFDKMNPSVVFDLEKYHPRVYKKVQQHKYEFLYGAVKENLEKGIKEELYRPEINTEILTRYRIESAMLPFNPEVFSGNRFRIVDIQEELLYHFLYGIVTAKGLKMMQKYKKQYQKL